MNLPVLPYILLLISTVRAFQYTELAQYIDSHEEEYVEVQYNSSSFFNKIKEMKSCNHFWTLGGAVALQF